MDKNGRRYSVILLDIDGTIFDFAESEHKCFLAAMEKRGIDAGESDYQLYRKINRAMWKKLEKGEITQEKLKPERFRLLFEEMGVDSDAQKANDEYLSLLAKSVIMMPGAKEFCKALHEKFKVVVVTNGIKDNQYSRVKRSDIAPYVDAMVTSEEVAAAKPNPKIFEEGIKRAGGAPKDMCVMIGDSYSADIMGAVNTGVDAIWFAEENNESTDARVVLISHDYDEILRFLGA